MPLKSPVIKNEIKIRWETKIPEKIKIEEKNKFYKQREKK